MRVTFSVSSNWGLFLTFPQYPTINSCGKLCLSTSLHRRALVVFLTLLLQFRLNVQTHGIPLVHQIYLLWICSEYRSSLFGNMSYLYSYKINNTFVSTKNASHCKCVLILNIVYCWLELQKLKLSLFNVFISDFKSYKIG